jgi:hypothetical protein
MGKIMIVERILIPDGSSRNSKTVNGVTGWTRIHERDLWYYVGAEVEIVDIGHEYGAYNEQVLIMPANSPKDFDGYWTLIHFLSPKP